MSAINKIGIELEGAWEGKRKLPPFSDIAIGHDGSVRYNNQDPNVYLHYGEIASKPMTVDEIVQWAMDHCPTHADNSAGTHLHVSLKNPAMYGSLMTPTFQRRLIDAYHKENEAIKDSDPETYQRFALRLAGKNHYCKRSFKGLSQYTMTGKGSDRYQQLNYCYAYHGTLEIRVLPCTSNKKFLGHLIEVTIAVIEDWVAKEYKAGKIRFRRG